MFVLIMILTEDEKNLKIPAGPPLLRVFYALLRLRLLKDPHETGGQQYLVNDECNELHEPHENDADAAQDEEQHDRPSDDERCPTTSCHAFRIPMTQL